MVAVSQPDEFVAGLLQIFAFQLGPEPIRRWAKVVNKDWDISFLDVDGMSGQLAASGHKRKRARQHEAGGPWGALGAQASFLDALALLQQRCQEPLESLQRAVLLHLVGIFGECCCGDTPVTPPLENNMTTLTTATPGGFPPRSLAFSTFGVSGGGGGGSSSDAPQLAYLSELALELHERMILPSADSLLLQLFQTVLLRLPASPGAADAALPPLASLTKCLLAAVKSPGVRHDLLCAVLKVAYASRVPGCPLRAIQLVPSGKDVASLASAAAAAAAAAAANNKAGAGGGAASPAAASGGSATTGAGGAIGSIGNVNAAAGAPSATSAGAGGAGVAAAEVATGGGGGAGAAGAISLVRDPAQATDTSAGGTGAAVAPPPGTSQSGKPVGGAKGGGAGVGGPEGPSAGSGQVREGGVYLRPPHAAGGVEWERPAGGAGGVASPPVADGVQASGGAHPDAAATDAAVRASAAAPSSSAAGGGSSLGMAGSSGVAPASGTGGARGPVPGGLGGGLGGGGGLSSGCLWLSRAALHACIDILEALLDAGTCHVPFYEALLETRNWPSFCSDDVRLQSFLTLIHRRRDALAFYTTLSDRRLRCITHASTHEEIFTYVGSFGEILFGPQVVKAVRMGTADWDQAVGCLAHTLNCGISPAWIDQALSPSDRYLPFLEDLASRQPGFTFKGEHVVGSMQFSSEMLVDALVVQVHRLLIPENVEGPPTVQMMDAYAHQHWNEWLKLADAVFYLAQMRYLDIILFIERVSQVRVWGAPLRSNFILWLISQTFNILYHGPLRVHFQVLCDNTRIDHIDFAMKRDKRTDFRRVLETLLDMGTLSSQGIEETKGYPMVSASEFVICNSMAVCHQQLGGVCDACGL
eukprot:jgi/Mesvir1/24260/Mv10962-RA.1